VAHEAGDLNDLRAILGNDVAITASREGRLPFPDGTIIARLAWSYDPSEENNKVFGRPQSFVVGPPKNGVQFMVKDSRKYVATGSWGSRNLTTASPPTRRCTCVSGSAGVGLSSAKSVGRQAIVAPRFEIEPLSKFHPQDLLAGVEVTSITGKVVREMEAYANTTERSLTVIQRVAICFTGGVLGALAVILFSHVLFGLGISGALGVKGPVALKSPDIYRPLFWGGLWGIPFGLFIKTAWERLYLFGLLYFLAPVLALFLIFLPMSGAGYFGLRQGGPMFTAYLLLVNVPFGIITAVAARAIIGKQPWALRTEEKSLQR
jgi:hypothetical protein